MGMGGVQISGWKVGEDEKEDRIKGQLASWPHLKAIDPPSMRLTWLTYLMSWRRRLGPRALAVQAVICPWRRMCGYLSGCTRDTWPKYVNLRIWSNSTMSLSIASLFMMSTFLHRSLLVTPQILLSTAISNTLSFLFCSCFNVQVSALYNTMVSLIMSLAAHTVLSFLTMPHASPIRRSISLSQDWSAETVPPRHTKCSVCFRLLVPSLIFIVRASRPMHCTSVLEPLTTSPNLPLVKWTLFTSCWSSPPLLASDW